MKLVVVKGEDAEDSMVLKQFSLAGLGSGNRKEMAGKGVWP